MIDRGDLGRLHEAGQFQWVAPRYAQSLDPDALVRPWEVQPEDTEELARMIHERIVMPDKRPPLQSGVESRFVPQLGHIAIRFSHGQDVVGLRLPLTPERHTRNKVGEDTWVILGVAQKLGVLVVATRKAEGFTAAVVPLANHALHAIIDSMQNARRRD